MIAKSHRLSALLVAAAALFGLSPSHDAQAESRRNAQTLPQAEQSPLQGTPVMAIVSIKDQSIAVYDATGAAVRARVSSGRPDYETPVGIYSVLQKQEEHYSNVYDDASMPFMQRITWSGVSLHEGQLPGYPASHGCVRMPHSFAQQIFPLTKVGMRVIVGYDNVAPVNISHPNLLKPAPVTQSLAATQANYQDASSGSVFEADVHSWPQRQAEMDLLKATAAAKGEEAERTKSTADDLKRIFAQKAIPHDKLAKTLKAADKVKKAAGEKAARASHALDEAKSPAKIKKFEDAKIAAAKDVADADAKLASANTQLQAASGNRDHTRAERVVHSAEKEKRAAEERASRAERELTEAQTPSTYKKWEDDKAKADAAATIEAAKVSTLQAEMQTLDSDYQKAKKDWESAEAARDAAIAVAKEAERKTFPVSLFVSLKTQRLYVRQGHEPVIDVPISIKDPQRPIGTHVFTAVDYAKDATDLNWTAVSLTHRGSNYDDLYDESPRRRDRSVEPAPTNSKLASAALDRIAIPQDVLSRISGSVWPGSSLIVSDEGLSKETGAATDFVVLMSGEPQGGIKRRPKPAPMPMFDRYYYTNGPNYYAPAYDRYGRPIRVRPRPIFGWW